MTEAAWRAARAIDSAEPLLSASRSAASLASAEGALRHARTGAAPQATSRDFSFSSDWRALLAGVSGSTARVQMQRTSRSVASSRSR